MRSCSLNSLNHLLTIPFTPQTFRSAPTNGNDDAVFQSFIAATPTTGPMGHAPILQQAIAFPEHVRPFGGHAASRGNLPAHALQTNGAGPAAVGGAQDLGWANEFRNTNGGANMNNAQHGMPVAQNSYAPGYNMATNGMAAGNTNIGIMGSQGYSPLNYGPAAMGAMGPMSTMGMPVTMGIPGPMGAMNDAAQNSAGPTSAVADTQNIAAANHAASGPIARLTADELQAKFAEFQEEYEFENAMSDWMDEHGPSQSEQAEAASAAAAKEIDAEMEYLADELESRRLNGDQDVQPGAGAAQQGEQREKESADELARTAHLIIQSVSSANSEKFKNSSFFDLMHRLKNREIVVKDSDLVDAKTGKPVVGDKSETSEATAAGVATYQPTTTADTAHDGD